MKLNRSKLRKMILNEMRRLDEQSMGMRNISFPNLRPTNSFNKATSNYAMTYNIMNGRGSYVDGNGDIRVVGLTGSDGTAYYYEPEFISVLQSAGYQEDRGLPVPSPQTVMAGSSTHSMAGGRNTIPKSRY